MTKPKGSKVFNEFEQDFIRLMIGSHGHSLGQVAAWLGRSKASVQNVKRKIDADGSLRRHPTAYDPTGQLKLPNLEAAK